MLLYGTYVYKISVNKTIDASNLLYKHPVCLLYSHVHRHELESLILTANQQDFFDLRFLKQKNLFRYVLCRYPGPVVQR